MSNMKTSLSEYVLDENYFEDFEYNFDYSIIHQENDTDYFSGTLTSALAEVITLKNNETLSRFFTILSQSKILIPIDISDTKDKSIMKLLHCRNNNYLNLENVNIVPQIKIGNKTRFFSIFSSIRETHDISTTFLYIDFKTVYKWIKKYHKDIDVITFDNFSEHYAWFINCDVFIKELDQFE